MDIVFSLLFVGLPLLSLGCLVYGVVVKGLCPRWLLFGAAVPPLVLALWWFISFSFSHGYTDVADIRWEHERQFLAQILYFLFAAGFLALAVLVPGRGWARRSVCLLALAIPAPLMVLILLDTWAYWVLR